MPFRPTLVPTLAAFVAAAITGRLGVWQVSRHGETEERAARIQARVDAEPVGEHALAEEPPDELDHKRASVQGAFVEVEPYLVPASMAGEAGYHVISPFRATGGTVLLVDRGWAPADWDGAHDAATEVTGLLVVAEGDPQTRPLPADGRWPDRWVVETEPYLGVFTRRTGPPFAGMVSATEGAVGVVLLAGPRIHSEQARSTDVVPAPGYVVRLRKVKHLAYAAQWFAMAAFVLALWGWMAWRRGSQPSQEP